METNFPPRGIFHPQSSIAPLVTTSRNLASRMGPPLPNPSHPQRHIVPILSPASSLVASLPVVAPTVYSPQMGTPISGVPLPHPQPHTILITPAILEPFSIGTSHRISIVVLSHNIHHDSGGVEVEVAAENGTTTAENTGLPPFIGVIDPRPTTVTTSSINLSFLSYRSHLPRVTTLMFLRHSRLLLAKFTRLRASIHPPPPPRTSR